MNSRQLNNPDALALDFQADLEEIRAVGAAVAEFLNNHKLMPLDVHGIFLALHEHCLNISQHGYPDGRSGPVSVELVIQPSEHGERIVMTVSDKGTEFNPNASAQPGLGINLIRGIAKIVEWERVGGENRTVFIFKVFKTTDGDIPVSG